MNQGGAKRAELTAKMEEKVFLLFGGFPRFLHLSEYLCGHFVLMPVILAHKQIIFMKIQKVDELLWTILGSMIGC